MTSIADGALCLSHKTAVAFRFLLQDFILALLIAATRVMYFIFRWLRQGFRPSGCAGFQAGVVSCQSIPYPALASKYARILMVRRIKLNHACHSTICRRWERC